MPSSRVVAQRRCKRRRCAFVYAAIVKRHKSRRHKSEHANEEQRRCGTTWTKAMRQKIYTSRTQVIKSVQVYVCSAMITITIATNASSNGNNDKRGKVVAAAITSIASLSSE